MIKTILSFILIVLISYFIGNISFARLLTRKKETKITELGSGNPGTMNMARNFGWKLGLLTLILDMLKAIVPCLIAFFVSKYYLQDLPNNLYIYTAGLSVILGHMFPVCYKFKGGKGIACALGVFAVAYPTCWFLPIFLLLGLVILLISKIGSLTSLTLVTGLSIISIIYFTHFVEIILIVIIYILLVFSHKKNIVRLIHGKENKVDLFKKKGKENVGN